MLTVKEYHLSLRPSFQVVGIHDGWRPLSIRSDEDLLVVSALVDTEVKEEAEVFRLIYHGQDIGALQKQEGVELAFLGRVHNGSFLFLDVKPADDEQARRPGRLDLEDFLKKGVDKSR